VLVILVTIAFFGLLTPLSSVLLSAPAGQAPADGAEPSTWMVLPVAAGLVVLLLLGIHPPADLSNLIASAAAELHGVGR
jgi:hydrogenase-4 component F